MSKNKEMTPEQKVNKKAEELITELETELEITFTADQVDSIIFSMVDAFFIGKNSKGI